MKSETVKNKKEKAKIRLFKLSKIE